MLHPETHTVTPENGPRPAGKPDECFYCNKKLGQEHTSDCVCRTRTVLLRYTFDVVEAFPATWTPEEIESSRNESTWCASSAIETLQRIPGCLCSHFKGQYIREATVNDEEAWGITKARRK